MRDCAVVVDDHQTSYFNPSQDRQNGASGEPDKRGPSDQAHGGAHGSERARKSRHVVSPAGRGMQGGNSRGGKLKFTELLWGGYRGHELYLVSTVACYTRCGPLGEETKGMREFGSDKQVRG
jgi:hypothetical protein